MRRHVVFFLKVGFYYTRTLGLLPYKYDRRRQQVRTTRALTAYSVAANLVVLLHIIGLLSIPTLTGLEQSGRELYQYILVVIVLVRIVTVLLTLVLNWKRRAEFMNAIDCFLRLRRHSFSRLPVRRAALRHFEHSIMQKFCWSLLVGVAAWASSMETLRVNSSWQVLMSVTSVSLLSHVLEAVNAAYYFAVVTINLHFRILNDELTRILWAARVALLRRRQQRCSGGFIMQCCQLADDVDELARAHAELQTLAARISNMLDVQGLCNIINLYLNNVAIIYVGYTARMQWSSLRNLSPLRWALAALTYGAYYWDVRVFIGGMLHMLEVHAHSATLLRQYASLSALDVRLERSFQNFSLQMVTNPFILCNMGLFNFTKPMAFSVFVSTVLHSIILMQIDYKNFKFNSNSTQNIIGF